MFMDAHTKVFALFLETLCELVSSHKADLYDWLYILLTRLLNKLGADLLGSVVHKINRTLDVVRESFNYEEQLAVIFKFLVDQTQTPNSKVKLATLQYLKSLVTLVESADVPTNKDSEMALAKIITWTSEPKSGDIRRAAHQALLSMFNTHTPQMALVLGKLPQVYQDSAAELLDKHLPPDHKISPGKPAQQQPSPGAPKPRGALQPSGANGSRPRGSPQKALGPDDSENMNPDEVNKSLRLTANAIQNYSFEKVDKMELGLAASGDLPDEKDSGISQVRLGANLISI
jgi:CLIP-associating protein 1/2